MSTDKNLVRAASLAVLLLAVMLGFTATPEALADPVMQVQADPAGDAQKAIEDALGQNLDANAGPFAVAIMGIIGVFIAPALLAIIVAWLWFRHSGRKEQMKFDTLKLMVEKGVEIPEQFSFMESAPAPGSSLRRGLILTGLGIGIVCFFILVGAREAAGLGGIPLFVGLAYLLIWRLEKNDTQSPR